jgi:exodeoxyribonuclease V alpha subunit
MNALESPLSRQFVACLRRFDPGMDEAVAWAAGLVSEAVVDGHVCIDLRHHAGRCTETGVRLPEVPAWIEALERSTVVGRPGAFKPLILEACRLYLARYWLYEKNLAEDLLARAGPVDEVDEERLRADLDRLFAHNAEQPDWQKSAAATAVLRRLCVISGGPGTGKTSTVVRILAALQSQAEGRLRIALAAPTGKAAARMQESIRAQKANLSFPQAVLDAIPETASTLHRLLGSRPDSVSFRHHRENPLTVDVVVVDEASMIDLALMAKLLEAVPAPARLILLGDKDQLCAVEAGAVFGDLCAGRGYSPVFRERLWRVTGVDVGEGTPQCRSVEPLPWGEPSGPCSASPNPLPADLCTTSPPAGHWAGSARRDRWDGGDPNSQVSIFSPPPQPSPGWGSEQKVLTKPNWGGAGASRLNDSITFLTRSHRFGGHSGIGELARLTNRGDAGGAVELLRSGRSSDIVWRPEAGVVEQLLARIEEGYRAYFAAVDAGLPDDGVLAAFHRFRVLTAHREGAAGAEVVNRLFDERLRERMNIAAHWYPGRPVMITRNDYGLKLFNGDVGICLPKAGELRVCFEDADGRIRSLAPGRLPEHETAYAMTVHKSQGSEFDEVVFLLPEPESPILNRPLMYTAITRARRWVEVWGSEQSLTAGIRKLPERTAGLRERLSGYTEK